MNREIMKKRTKQFGLDIIRIVDALPRTTATRAISWQLIGSGSSVGASYRSACRGRSKKEFSAKLGISLEECDESGYWLEVLRDSGFLGIDEAAPLLTESDELCAILYTTIQSSRE